jgi:uncharacterized protein DUF3499
MSRTCARPGCSAAASTTLLYDYRERTTWLEPLAAEAHPMAYDLCDAHAARFTVPQGWRLEDRRAAFPDEEPAYTPGYDPGYDAPYGSALLS